MAATTGSKSGAMPDLRIVYLPFRAMAETTRFILEYGNIPYTDEVVWGLRFNELRSNSEFPYDKVPVIDVDGRRIPQSGAITRYVAKLAGVYPEDPVECAFSDSIFETAQELCTINPMINCYAGRQYDMIHDDYFQRLPRQLANIQRQLDTRTFFGGDSPSYADFSMFHHCDNILTAEPGAMDGYDGLQAWMARMQALPRLKEYLSKRPQLVGIGTDPGLLDRNGTLVTQRKPCEQVVLLEDGLFVFE